MMTASKLCCQSQLAPLQYGDDTLWEWGLRAAVGAQLKFKIVTIDPGDAVVQWSQGADIQVTVPNG
jgi:hypothetical protein